jgi:hypothetical protein
VITKIWHDPVWSKVIATGILGILGIAITSWFQWWPAIGAAAHATWALLIADTATPNWLLIILALCTFAVCFCLAALLWGWLAPAKLRGAQEPQWTDYLADTFLDLRWRWTFQGHHPRNIAAFCPKCDYQLSYRSDGRFGMTLSIAFHCDACQWASHRFEEDYLELESKIERFVQQKLRNGSWKSVVREYSQNPPTH